MRRLARRTRLATCDANHEVLVWDPTAAVVVLDKMVYHRSRGDVRGVERGRREGSRRARWTARSSCGTRPNRRWRVAWWWTGARGRSDAFGVAGREHVVSGGFDACVRTWTLREVNHA